MIKFIIIIMILFIVMSQVFVKNLYTDLCKTFQMSLIIVLKYLKVRIIFFYENLSGMRK